MWLLTLAELLLALMVAPAAAIGCDVSFLDGLLADLAASKQARRVARKARVISQREVQRWVLEASSGLLSHTDSGCLQLVLREQGMSRNAWKLFSRHGNQLMWPLQYCREIEADPVRETILCANLFAAIGRPELPPRELVAAAGHMRSMRWFGDDGLIPAYIVKLIAAAWTEMDTFPGADERAGFAERRLMRVVEWWRCNVDACVIPGDAGWPWFERTAKRALDQAWFAREPCVTFGNTQQIFEHRVVPLHNFAELRQAGEHLRNCMQHATPKRRPANAHFLITNSQDRPLAMFDAPASAGRTSIEHIFGTQNRPVTDYMRTLAMLYLLHEHDRDEAGEAPSDDGSLREERSSVRFCRRSLPTRQAADRAA